LPPKETTRYFSVVKDITELLVEDFTNVRDFLKRVLLKANEVMNADWGFVAIVEKTQGQEWLVVWDPEQDIVGARSEEWKGYRGRLRVGSQDLPRRERSITGYVASIQQLYCANDVRNDEFYCDGNSATRSELGVPILFRNELLAVMNFESRHRDHFRQEHKELLSLIAKLVSAPLHGMLISDGIYKPAVEVAVLDSIRRCLSETPVGSSWDASGALDEVAKIAAGVLNSRQCFVWLTDAGEIIMKGMYLDGCQDGTTDWHRRFVLQAIEDKRLLKYQGADWNGEPPLAFQPDVAAPLSSQMSTPMLSYGRAVGAITVGCRRISRETPRPYYTNAEEQLLNIIQAQLAAFVDLKRSESVRIFQSSQRSQRISQIMRNFTEVNLQTALEEAVKVIPELCEAKFSSVFLWDERLGEFVLKASRGLDPKWIDVARYRLGEGLTGWVGKHGVPLILDSRTNLAAIAPDLIPSFKYNEASSDDDPDLHPFAAVPIFREGKTFGVLRVSDRYRGFFSEADELMLTLVASKISSAIAYSERYEERIRVLHGLQELMAFTRSLPLPRMEVGDIVSLLLEQIASLAQTIFRASIVTIYGVSDGQIETPPKFAGEFRDRDVMYSALRPGDVPFLILSTGQPRYWTDVSSESLLTTDIKDSLGGKVRERFTKREEIISAAGIPLAVAEKITAVLFLSYRTPQSFDDERRKLIEAFASQAALSLEIGRLYNQLRESASREEALTLADELHETKNTLSLLVGGRLGFAMDRLKAGDASGALADMSAVSRYVSDCVAEIKGILGELQKSLVPLPPLADLISSYANELCRDGLNFQLDVRGSGEIPPRIKRHLYLIGRSIINNVINHANATNLCVSLTTDPSYVVLRIQDNGVGFTPSLTTQKPGSLGLRAVQRRSEKMNGLLEINSEVGSGATVTVTVPLYTSERAIPRCQGAAD
jgi:GAF domain-containing protein